MGDRNNHRISHQQGFSAHGAGRVKARTFISVRGGADFELSVALDASLRGHAGWTNA